MSASDHEVNIDPVDPMDSEFGFEDEAPSALSAASPSLATDLDNNSLVNSPDDLPGDSAKEVEEAAEVEVAQNQPKKKKNQMITYGAMAAAAIALVVLNPLGKKGGQPHAEEPTPSVRKVAPAAVLAPLAAASQADVQASGVALSASVPEVPASATSTASMFADAASVPASAPVVAPVPAAASAPVAKVTPKTQVIDEEKPAPRAALRVRSHRVAPASSEPVAAPVAEAASAPARRVLDLAASPSEMVDASASASLRGFSLHAISPPHGEEYLQAWVRVGSDGRMHVLSVGDVLPGTSIRVRLISNSRRLIQTSAGALVMK
jgi:hypothetical protein